MTRFRPALFLLTAFVATASPVAAAQPTLNAKVVAFCKDHLGKQVGGGECSDLPDAALAQVGA